MQVIADLHFHSKYSRAVSPDMVLPEIARWAVVKGIDLVTTTDFTHPLWLREIRANLEEVEEGTYRLKGQKKPLFILTTEISSIYTQGGRLRRIHNLVFAPNLEEAGRIEEQLASRGNVMSDGRPIFGLSAREITEIILDISPESLIIPAHAWTPHFSLYGSESGFDSMEECFGNMAKNIYAIETGLSSDPAMNWRIGELDNRSIISCSDAHSGAKLGREATVFAPSENGTSNLSYENIRKAIMQQPGGLKISHTIEFYPEEGKYHYTGHRNCQVKQSPEQTRKLGTACPVCGKGLTVGVMHRVEQLATREIPNSKFQITNDEYGVKWIGYESRPPYVMLVPLLEILAEAMGSSVSGQKATNEYKKLTSSFGGEFNVLLTTKLEEISKVSGPRVTEAIKKIRSGDIVVDPGYDGIFGTVKIWPFVDAQGKPSDSEEEKEQLSLF